MAERAKGFRRFSEELVVRRTGNTTAEWDRPDGPGRAPVWGHPLRASASGCRSGLSRRSTATGKWGIKTQAARMVQAPAR